jgi:DNA-binding NarL/FixJ family response regulator
MDKIKILLVDDHAVVRKGLISLLEDESQLKIVGDVGSGKEALEFVKNHKVDIVLLDLNMPEMSGIETAKHLSKTHPKLKKLVFSMHNDPDYVLKSIENGVDGYILTKKTTTKDNKSVLDLLSKKELEILQLVAKGLSSQEIAEKLELSVRTVSNHRANMLRKTNINNTTELVGILKSEDK